LFESINAKEIHGNPYQTLEIIISKIVKNNGINKISCFKNLKYLNKTNKILKKREIITINKNEK